MSFIPTEEQRDRLNLAPMLDFLFLMLVFFATIAVSRASTQDTNIDLVKVQPETKASSANPTADKKIIMVSVNAEGKYQWITEMRDYPMETEAEIAKELKNQYSQGLLPEDKEKTQVLVRIDKEAKWEPILKLIFAIRDAGFTVHPVYEPEVADGSD